VLPLARVQPNLCKIHAEHKLYGQSDRNTLARARDMMSLKPKLVAAAMDGLSHCVGRVPRGLA
jgi:hypothetical protein